ncbi:MAG TPA: hypothetical protein VLG28_12280 [Acidimicrobiia bacterium]|nr:hypothetical protein [Acidimicrobiia bacterium]
MREQGTGKSSPAVRLLEEIDRMRRRLAQRFVESTSVTERFAISQELGRLLERKRRLLLLSSLNENAATG